MDDKYDEIKMNQILESEKIFALKRNIYEENEDKSPNKIIQRSQRSEINLTEDSQINKQDNILKINQLLKPKNIYQSNNELLNDKNSQLYNNKEESPSLKLCRKNSGYNKSKDALNYNQLQMDLIRDLQTKTKSKNQKNTKKNFSSIKSEKNDKLIISLYKEHVYFYKKKCVFIILFIIGILFSILNLFLSIALTLYGNIELLSIFIVLNLFLIFFYAIGIYFFEKFKVYALKIISNINSPEKIENSHYKNNIYLLIYFFIFAINYYLAIMCGLTFYKNNIKFDIKSRAYDKNKWRFYFQNKSFENVLNLSEQIIIAIMIFGWSSIIILITILSLFIYIFKSYQFYKRIIQAICFLFGQISFLLLNMSAYCFQFRNISLLDEYKLHWVILGNIFVACFGIILSYGFFYMFFTENIKLIKYFKYIGILFILLSMVFTGGSKVYGLKFDDYKNANCNNLFKFISEDYLVKNKDCKDKYLFSQNDLKDMQCPKNRIMINWEETENLIEEGNDLENIPVYGCINQYCCLKIYCKLKNGFNVQEILAFNQLILLIILYICLRYMHNNIEKSFEEEIMEKFNLLTMSIFTFTIYVICFIIIILRPPTSSQNILNNIEAKPISTENAFINKNWISLSENNKVIEEYNILWNKLINNYFMETDLEIINSFGNEFNFEYFEYNISSNNLYIEKKSDNNNANEILLDYNINNVNGNGKIINFKSKTFLINSLNKYFTFKQYNLFQPENTILITCNIIFTTNIDENYLKNKINQISQTSQELSNSQDIIKITNELILLNYKSFEGKSFINIIMNKTYPLIKNESIISNDSNKNKISSFYIKGDIFNDKGLSSINIYSGINNLIYSEKTNIEGEFSIGPFYFNNSATIIYELKIEIFKIKNNDNNELLYDENYNNYTTLLKIGGYGFNNNFIPFILKNISLPKIINKEFQINGRVFTSKEYSALDSVAVKLYKGNKDINVNNNSVDDINLITKVFTNKNGVYNLKSNQNGQYTLIFSKDDFFMEKYDLIIENSNVEVKNIVMIQLFNSGKINVKMDWENNPPDLDLICRFKVKGNNYCYTFFGNNKCVDTNFPRDNKKGGNNGPEIIEIETLGDYNYFFYVRKYFDISNNTAKMERKISNFETNDNNISLYYKQNDELIINSKVKLSLYANGLRTPAFILNIPYEENFNETNIYWAGFCLNKNNEGLKGINVINKFYENEPPKDICFR